MSVAESPAQRGWLASFSERERELALRGPAWLGELRRRLRRRFDELGLPTTRDEAWKNTSLAALAATDLRPPASSGVSGRLPAQAEPDLGGPRLVFLDGRLADALSRPGAPGDGLRVASLAAALHEMPERLRPLLEREDPGAGAEFRALNGALGEDGAVVIVGDGVSFEQPVQLTFLAGEAGQATTVHPRTLVVVGRNSRLTIVESYAGPQDRPYFTNAVSEIVVGDGASVEHYRLQLESEQAFHVSSITSRQGRDSRYTAHNVNLGGRLTRHHVRAIFEGAGGSCELFGLSLTRGSQHVDNHTLLDHAQPHCGSRELYKSVLDGRSRSVFSGRIVVRKDAQKTDAKQSNPNLLLSATALAHTRPQLEIHADDVKCTHGATIGQLDEDALFYLRSRGIAASEARALLVRSFAGEVLERAAHEPLRAWLGRRVDERLAAPAVRP
jgi:Fe-S cluster assembly protein SufD